jgi:hypothetical protein
MDRRHHSSISCFQSLASEVFDAQSIRRVISQSIFARLMCSLYHWLHLLYSNDFIFTVVDRNLHKPTSVFSTPSHSPFIPDISLTSPEIHTKSLNVGSNNVLFQSHHAAMSPIPLRTISWTSPAARTPGHESRDTTPNSRSRHSFPPTINPSTAPSTPISTVHQLHPSVFSPQRVQYNGRTAASNQAGAAGSSSSFKDARYPAIPQHAAYKP